jgi:alkanesulfonate monooxygenase SsuD/methylene tetrahydromethanopterin reductase-like flavin-dependent oxidoreductase (luciferase family)
MPGMPRLGAALPLQNLSPTQQVAYIQQAETSGYDSAWVPEVVTTPSAKADGFVRTTV